MKKNFYPKVVHKIYFTLALLVFISIQSRSQQLGSFLFSKLPQDYQLYPRNEQSEAFIPIAGRTETAGYKYVSVQVFRNQTLLTYLRGELKYDSKGVGTFAIETKIKAELAEYSFKVYAMSTDSALLVHRQNVVSGDAYILTGQSNSTGFFNENQTNEYCRSFGKITETLNTERYNPADTLWALSNQPKVGVGPMGFEIQKQLIAKSGVPNCLINGGFHWSSAWNHAQRTEANPADLNNGYGRMLYRVQKAGLTSSVKAFIFRQGESEAYNEGFDWELNFKKMYANLKLDLPNLKKLYVFQIDVIYFPTPVGAIVRDYQRRLPQLFPDIRSISTVGTQGFDGLHYAHEGYVQNGLELSRLIARDFYQLKDTINIDSPSLKKAFYKNDERKQLILLFDEGQQIVYPEMYRPKENVILDIKDLFLLNGQAGTVRSGKAENNKIILELNGTQNANTLNYLPDYLPEGNIYYPFTGPFITNKLGMRAFSFYQAPIGTALQTPKLNAAPGTELSITLSWTKIPDAAGYVLERKRADETTYKLLARLNSSSTNYQDLTAIGSGKVDYRLKAINDLSESADFGFAQADAPIVLAIQAEPVEIFNVFPNPVSKNQKIFVRFKTALSGSVSLINAMGQIISHQVIEHKTEATFNSTSFTSGFYFIKFRGENSGFTRKILVQ
ncbi:sialate O-acetylesterase [Dyadobacter psychrotolerans]|uniref:T9SS type A sorting domain-containing protein n=1 Tax=Dyadobacter psychrotolerans TaxID=2541721 RepID=A0A4R5DSR4_9BACT|nr:sialate O-acetylesterase [Dyadobacter psychrotolerans]TDE17399.1 T9SS type A sorting domain-containing protein [Dyadobacter psychrotolerans]